ncbi:hypothetical protein ACFP81_02010 [Deinococcus lacus]|uniref:Uncharacterized protein n=1 Tax=Deinococcus lacus TaxID=392561 RepID=A0ABW1Y9D6_9DEIO
MSRIELLVEEDLGQLFIDREEILSDSWGWSYYGSKPGSGLVLYLYKGIFERLKGFQLRDFSHFKLIKFEYPIPFDEDFSGFNFSGITFIPEGESMEVRLECDLDILNWKQSWSLAEQMTSFVDKIGPKLPKDWSIRNLDSIKEGEELNSIDIVKEFKKDSEYFDECMEIIHMIETVQDDIFMENNFKHGETSKIVREFDFPESIRVYCEQYLIFFAEFLRDMGIQATTSVGNESGYTIFSVIPTDREDALEKIQILLGEYLKLPSIISMTDSLKYSDSIEAQKLLSNIHHLQGQLGLALATIRQQMALIDSKDEIIRYQNEILKIKIESGRVLLDYAKDLEISPEEENIIEGILSVKKYEIGPLSVDLPSILRFLKEKFGGR